MAFLDIDIHLRRDLPSESQPLLHLEYALPDAVTSIEAVEQYVHRQGFDLLRRLFASLLEAHDRLWATARQHQDATCRVTNEETRGITLKTLLGAVEVRRQRQYCHTHEVKFLPFNRALGLDLGNVYLTRGLMQGATLAALNMPYDPAATWVDYFTCSQDLLDPSEVQHLVVAHGQAVRQQEKEREDRLRQAEVIRIQDRMWQTGPLPARTGILYISVDGIMIREQPGRGEWLTGYAGILFTPAKERIGKARFRLTEKRYITSFAGLTEFGDRLQGAARLMQWEQYAEIRWLVDGTRELLALAHTHSPRDGRVVIRLDGYHLAAKVKTRLTTAFPERAARRKALLAVNTLLWHGQSEEAIAAVAALRPARKAGPPGQEALDKLGAYLQRNLPYLGNYWAEQKAGYMISSAHAEKACDVLIAKRQKKEQGMRWGPTGADAIAALRTWFFNGEWEEYWEPRSAML